ncbi:MAG: TIGR00282 family metallophosphoesterase [Alphaproteobacteria bacterium]|nr:TIGR00282 family metallophosphoesterase [Alphaproteobacteria bacterium]MCZ6763937.1 TIGR00282 family metallophosphoesterase [Alphaproteobacteria bacterium]
MKVLFCGDVMGKPGRQVLEANIKELRRRLGLDFVIANGENAAHGFGITAKQCDGFYEAGVDAITTGNHVWDQRDILPAITSDKRLLRPLNYPERTPGRGSTVLEAGNGGKVLLISVITRLYMGLADDPFGAVETVLGQYRLGHNVDAIILDVHGEATSEKMAMGHAFDGRVSLIVGTHTHVPTADTRILAGGTGYQTDIGMCGVYDSVIGMKKETAIERFVTKRPGDRLSPADGQATLCAVYADIDDATGLARRVAPLVQGGDLETRWPVPEEPS